MKTRTKKTTTQSRSFWTPFSANRTRNCCCSNPNRSRSNRRRPRTWKPIWFVVSLSMVGVVSGISTRLGLGLRLGLRALLQANPVKKITLEKHRANVADRATLRPDDNALLDRDDTHWLFLYVSLRPPRTCPPCCASRSRVVRAIGTRR